MPWFAHAMPVHFKRHNRWCASVALALVGLPSLLSVLEPQHCWCPAYAYRPRARSRHRRIARSSEEQESSGLGWPVGLPLPLGPLCPFRSSFWESQPLTAYTDDMESKQRTCASLMMKVQMGERLPDNERDLLCAEMRSSNEMWLATNMRLKYAEDFQAVELFNIFEAKMLQEGMSMAQVEALTRWQPDHMEAVLHGRPPPPMPSSLDPAAVQRLSQKLPSVMNSFAAAPKLTAPPLTDDSAAFRSSVVQDEYIALMRDHGSLISFGGSYGSFDPRGKEAFLDQFATIHDRWKVFVTRLRFVGDLNPLYVEEGQAYLQQSGFTIDDFSTFVDKSHSLMREQAVQEGIQR